ncbi:intracellular hyphae protein 1 [Colletotrichum orchidophilum]|uniref:Intracellular hyphae protein 1 n=1 Tax=Colletotrichum orchidophilum TaxID=1209926 RepID=A0A1G4B3M1_9PEZI|nr:intracellular hyphae protein 1 [Colletotrichum orchidophilum]OHE96001.1 intracellular hyphae protein 1 [Colletotrichum orchidophilum]
MRFSIFTVLAAAASFAAALPATSCSAPDARPSEPCGKLGNFHVSTVKVNQTLGYFAYRYNSGICDIANASHIANPDVIFVGQRILIPVNVCKPDNTTCTTPPGSATCIEADVWKSLENKAKDKVEIDGNVAKYQIKGGDTFYALSKSWNITLASLTGVNVGVEPTALQIGQTINVPIC